jgi:hypothetical protein
MASHSGSSCLPNPVCTNKNITFSPSDYKNADIFRPILLYNGNSSAAPFTLDYGYLGAGPEGVLLELTAPTQTKLASTEFMLYGNMELTARHTPLQGLVFTFITMSNIKDEIDNEQTTAVGSEIFTNFFSQGQTVSGSSATVKPGNGFDVSDWHTYGINWQQDELQWTVDGTVVKSVSASSLGNSYPRSPSQVQISVWAGGNDTNTQGVIDWSGGPIDWTNSQYTSQGYYSAEIKSYAVTCASQKVSGITTTGNGTTPTSWIYTGQTSSSLSEPEFMLSTNPLTFLKNPSAGGTAGLPGYSTQSDFTSSNKNAWDGSGDTSGLSAAEISGKSGSNSGGWLDNNKALSIAVPVAAAIVVIIAIWAIAVRCARRRRRSRENDSTRNNVNDTLGGAVMNIGSGGGSRNSAYSKLDEDEEDDITPMGAQRVGKGYGPGVGPTPGPQSRYLDSVPTLQDTRGYGGSTGYDSYAMSNRSNSPNPQSQAVRGPYTPAMNAYTPAIAQTPAMRSYQQQPYATPAYNTGGNYAQRPNPPPAQYRPQQQQHYQQQGYPQYSQQNHPRQGGYPQQPSHYGQQQQQQYRNY